MQLLLVVCLTDLLQYWLHRASHRWEWLWRFHAIHHSAERLYWLNTGRFHPFDAALTYLASLPLLWILGCPEQTIALYLILATSHGPLQHSNIDMRLGPLNWVLCQAELHRWHHSPLRGERDMNYGAITILWDVVFGTRFLPARRPPEALGIGSMPYFPRKFGPQLLAPLRWRSLPRLPEAQNDHPEAI
jgi:sterol desaturase/sphingolipid hydroxylase (fatty acid hydroxylase superfamily)